ncbi:hypothetical protein OBBRIDRAFT_884524 [Obba rivulosa]|uniref:Uncharacterized protein n=1 Tax=Obba rivulosa TaxID=1052685 RepID=A0A8E2DSD1_9APHY|nr:hypothetical protein OBBRIDRAFT_884524 [Obba rivulosa]
MLRREQSRASAATAHSADAPQPRFKEIPQAPSRKLSRGKTELGKKGLLSRKFVKQTADSPIEKFLDATATSSFQTLSSIDKEKEREGSVESTFPEPPSFHSVSIIPDTLAELPSWYRSEVEWAAASAAHIRANFPLHDPSGPRYYRNRHLLPPLRQTDAPTTFSPSFPPMPSAPDRAQDPARMPARSRTPSGSPLPTPSSSQVRIHDPNGRVRTRKTSQNGNDNVDMLDVTDPWGSNFHHRSPYDVGVHSERSASGPEPESPTSPVASRPRRRSFNAGIGRHKTVTPSPLSQSTSAIHLHSYDESDHHLPRRLTKRRKPFAGLFGGHHSAHKRTIDKPAPPSSSHASSPQSTKSEQGLARRRSTKRDSALPTSSSVSSPPLAGAGHPDKRGSMLGRLARRFSILRKPDTSKSPISHDWQDVTSPDTLGRQSSSGVAPSGETQRSSVHPSKSQEPVKRVPPPNLAAECPLSASRSVASKDDNASMTSESLGSPVRGKLTVANPDEPSDNDATPVKAEAQLPPPRPPQREPSISADVQSVSPDVRSAKEDAYEHIPEIPGSDVSSIKPADAAQSAQLPPSVLLGSEAAPDDKTPMPKPSPPLPAVPLAPSNPPLDYDYDHTLPPTPKSSRPSSLALTERPQSSSVRFSQTEQTLSRAASLTTVLTSGISSTVLDDSPLSRVSILANPPTPHAIPAVLIPDISTMPKIVTKQDRVAPSESSPTKEKDGSRRVKNSKGRQTETFMLVRSPSGTVHPQGEVILAMGEQWAVVESPIDTSKRTRAKDRSRSHDPADDRVEETTPKLQLTADGPTSYSRARPSTSPIRGGADASRRAESHGRVAAAADEQSPETDRGRQHRNDSSTTKSPSLSRDEHRASLGRNLSARTSGSARPTSGLPSAAEMSTLRAKDAWEMERLWKARSMAYGPDGVPIVSTPPTIGDNSRPSTITSSDFHHVGTIPSTTDVHRLASMPVTHGSSHAYYSVQKPAHRSNSTTHAHMPSASQVDIYSSHTVQPSTRASNTHHHHSQSPRPNSGRTPTSGSPTDPTPFRHNPLPEPPRMVSYQAPPLPPSLAGPRDSTASEFRTKHAGLTTTH